MRKIWPWRRAFQTLVLGSLLAVPMTARYGHFLNARRLDKVMEGWRGTAPGAFLGAADAALRLGLPRSESGVAGRRPRKAILRRVEGLAGSIWSARVFGISMTDLMAAAESAAASRSARGVLITGLLLPLAATILLGRVYCGWVCPMGLLLPLARRLRSALVWLELAPLSVRLWRGNKYLLLGAGLAAALLTGLPLLQYIYPPALLGREAHSWVAVVFDRAEAGLFGWPRGALTSSFLFLALIAFVEAAIAPGFWCASVCPGGALYSILGRWRLLRVKRDAKSCVDCVLCDRACPMELEPMSDRMGAECDNCGVCIDVCPVDALAYRVVKPKTGRIALSALLLLAIPARAHHILGIPHYAYDKNYPQAPVLKLLERMGPWEVQLTAYPGSPQPGERSELHVYMFDSTTKAVYDRPILFEADRIRLLGAREKLEAAAEGLRDQGLYKFHVAYPEVGNYELVLTLPGLDGTSTMRFPMVVGEPGSPWESVGIFGGGFTLFFLLIRALKIKRLRRAAARA